MREAYAGVDVSFAKGKCLPVAVCTWEGERLVPFPLRDLPIEPPRGLGNVATLDEAAVRSFALRAAAYLLRVSGELDLSLVRIGIDPPSSPCRSPSRRASERALDREGINCFPTPSVAGFEAIKDKVRAHLDRGGAESHLPHANQLWMLAGFALFAELGEIAECIEVYPQATVRALDAGGTHKSESGAVKVQAQAVARHTGWPNPEGPPLRSISWARAHDCLDAYLSAWVAALDEADRTPLGDPPDDVIWVPKVDGHKVQIGTANNTVVQLTEKVSSESPRPTLCPACGEMEFKRWPWGWDAHAAFKCKGLSGEDPEIRKREFRQRFREHFGH